MKKILVIEDDEILNSGLCYNIEKIELYPVPAYCINDAKQKLKEDTFDLILLDVNLPDGNGCKRSNAQRWHSFYFLNST